MGSEIEVLVLGVRTMVLSDPPEALSESRIRITTHAEPLSALVSLREIDPDAVVVPLDPRGVDAPQLVEAVSREANLPCLVTWSRDIADGEKLARCIEAGATGLLGPRPTARDLAGVLAAAGVGEHASRQIRLGTLQIDPAGMAVRVGDRRCDLSPGLVTLVEYLALRSPRYVDVDELLDLLGLAGRPKALHRAIARLRQDLKKLDLPWEPVESIRGRGYRLVGQDSVPAG